VPYAGAGPLSVRHLGRRQPGHAIITVAIFLRALWARHGSADDNGTFNMPRA
jgi:hypothetical protein